MTETDRLEQIRNDTRPAYYWSDIMGSYVDADADIDYLIARIDALEAELRGDTDEPQHYKPPKEDE